VRGAERPLIKNEAVAAIACDRLWDCCYHCDHRRGYSGLAAQSEPNQAALGVELACERML